MLGLSLHLEGKAKEVLTYDDVKRGFVVRLGGGTGRLKVIALKRRSDGLYLMARTTVLLKGREVEMYLKPTRPIYSSNYPYSLTGGKAPKGIVIIQNLGDEPVDIDEVEVEVR